MTDFSDLEIQTFVNAARCALAEGEYRCDVGSTVDARSLRRRFNALRLALRLEGRVEEAEAMYGVLTGTKGSVFTLRRPGYNPAVRQLAETLTEEKAS